MIEVMLLLIFILVAAVVAVEIKSLLSAVVAHAAVGLGLCVVFFTLRAQEVAITQLTVELLVLVILLQVTGVRRDMAEYFGGLREIFAVSSVLLFIAIFGLSAIWAMHFIPKFGFALMTVSNAFVGDALLRTGAQNAVSAILLDFRAFDMLGAVAVLFASVTGVFMVLRKKGKEGSNERNDTSG